MITRSISRRSSSGLLLIALAAIAFGCVAEQHPVPAASDAQPTAGALMLLDVNGRQVRPLMMEPRQRAAVLIFVAVECPICNAYAGEINRLSLAYATRGVRFLLVDVDTSLSAADVRDHAHAFQLTPTVVLDPKHLLAKKYSARTTPEVIVIDSTCKVAYRGRIDDLYVGLGQRRYEADKHDLRDALDALLAGRKPPVAVTPPVGCAI